MEFGQSRSFNLGIAMQTSIEAALIYDELSFWSSKGSRSDGYIYKSMDELRERLPVIKERTMRRSIDLLQEKGYIEKKIMKANGAPTMHFKIAKVLVVSGQNGQMDLDKMAKTETGVDLDKMAKTLTATTATNTINRKSTKSALEKNKNITLSEESRTLANRLRAWISNNYPERTIKDSHVEKWAKSINDLHRIDKKSWHDINRVLDWSQKNEFWRTVIKSGEKFRKQYDNLNDKIMDEERIIKSKQKTYTPTKTAPHMMPDYKDNRTSTDSEAYRKFQEAKKVLLTKKQH